MEDLAIIGAGGLGREVLLIINKINKQRKRWNVVGFFDDNLEVNGPGNTLKLNYLGNIGELNACDRSISVVIAVGNPLAIFDIQTRISNTKISYPNIISNDSIFDEDSLHLGRGNIIAPGCIFTDNIKIGDYNLFNNNTCVGHDVSIGHFNVFNPGTTISGSVTIGDRNFFGLNSSIIQGKTIGSFNKIGAATLMTRNIKDSESFFGIPGKKLDSRF